MDKETYVKRMTELNHIREKFLQFNDKEREKAVESYNAANCPQGRRKSYIYPKQKRNN